MSGHSSKRRSPYNARVEWHAKDGPPGEANNKWSAEFASALQENGLLRESFDFFLKQGCSEGNLRAFVSHYQLGQLYILDKRQQDRDFAVRLLNSAACHFDAGVADLRDALDTQIGTRTVAQILAAPDTTVTMNQVSAEVVQSSGPREPPATVVPLKEMWDPSFAIDKLSPCAQELRWLATLFMKKMGKRQVGKSLYMVTLALDIEAATGKKPSWTKLANLLGQYDAKDPGGLSKNFSNFARHDKKLYKEICSYIAAYMAECAVMPQTETPTFIDWQTSKSARCKSAS